MTTLVEVLKQNEQENKEKEDIASKLASFLETEEITKVLTETIVASKKNNDIEVCVQEDNDYISLRVINSKIISFTAKEMNEGNTPPIELLNARFKISGSDKIGENDKSQLMEFILRDICVEVYNYNSVRLSSDKALYYLKKVIGVED
jgi:hypothetical protein